MCILWLAITTPGRAEDGLDVPSACGSRAELERSVAELVGADAGTRAPGPAVAMRRDGEGYLLEVQLEQGRRTLRDRDCRALFRAAVSIAALGREALIGLEKGQDAGAGAGGGTEAGAAPETATASGAAAPATAAGEKRGRGAGTATVRTAATDPATATDRATPKRTPRPRDTRMGATVHAGLAYGVVPEYTLALGAGVYFERGWMGGRFVASYQLPRSHHDREKGVRSDALGASATLLCGALRALRAGELARARALLDEHESSYTRDALLTHERERMRAELANLP